MPYEFEKGLFDKLNKVPEELKKIYADDQRRKEWKAGGGPARMQGLIKQLETFTQRLYPYQT